jgi:hypothetical protein
VDQGQAFDEIGLSRKMEGFIIEIERWKISYDVSLRELYTLGVCPLMHPVLVPRWVHEEY